MDQHQQQQQQQQQQQHPTATAKTTTTTTTTAASTPKPFTTSMMNSKAATTFRKWRTVLGAHLLMWFMGVPWYWGSLSVYTMSYFCKYHPTYCQQGDVGGGGLGLSMVIPLYVAGTCLGYFLSAVMTNRLGARLTVLLASVVFSGGWLACYALLRCEFPNVFVVVLGLVVSTSGSVVDGAGTLRFVECSSGGGSRREERGRDLGFELGIVYSGFITGPLFINQFITFFINPDNLLPDVQVEGSKIFSQDDVVDRVPSLFLCLAAISFLVNMVGLLLIWQKPQSDNVTETKITTKQDGRRERNSDEKGRVLPGVSHGRTTTPSLDLVIDNCKSAICHSYSIDVAALYQQTDNIPDLSPPSADITPTPLAADDEVPPKEVIRSSKLYQLWFFFIISEVPMLVLSDFYKSYGLQHINDDHFLTNLSSALLLVIAMSRPFWGWALDRFGLKRALMLHFAGSVVLSFCMYFSAILNEWCYFSAVLAFGWVGTPIYVLFTYTAIKEFGKKHFLVNYGLIMLPTILLNVPLTRLMDFLLMTGGWFWIFGFTSCCALAGLVVVVISLLLCRYDK